MGSRKRSEPIPLHSPRHPKHMAEAKRVIDILARDAADRECETKVRAGHANERPAGRDWAVAKSRNVPDAKRTYVAAPGPNHPLTRAHKNGKIDAAQFSTANAYRIIWEAAFKIAWGRDSTQAMMVDGGKQNFEAFIDILRGDAEAQASLDQIHRRLGKESAAIILFVCGMGHEVGDAVRWATPKVHANGVWGRFEEAIDALGEVINFRPLTKSA